MSALLEEAEEGLADLGGGKDGRQGVGIAQQARGFPRKLRRSFR
jgi:hypothetical protein